MSHHHSPSARYYNGVPPNYAAQSNGPYHREPVPRPPSTDRKFDPYPQTNGAPPSEAPPPTCDNELLQDSAIRTCMRWDDNRMKDAFGLVL